MKFILKFVVGWISFFGVLVFIGLGYEGIFEGDQEAMEGFIIVSVILFVTAAVGVFRKIAGEKAYLWLKRAWFGFGFILAVIMTTYLGMQGYWIVPVMFWSILLVMALTMRKFFGWFKKNEESLKNFKTILDFIKDAKD
ncbi:MAG: hypothetical protein LGR52_10785 [Candidatus Thiosymbion ectosymbiont of Robbea hypermnestra]|nr:hypothetical protein [Candidatus Thiosymbion ectosymbiont of Robbea hypermnestra]